MKLGTRSFIVLCLTLALLCGSVVATADTVSMTQGIYENRFTVEGRGEFVAYIHFYENGVYYISLYGGGQYNAGYWSLEDGEFDFYPNAHDGDMETTAKADKVLKLTNLDGSEYATLGYDSTLDRVVNLASYYNFNFDHIADSAHTDEDEVGINVIEYYLPEDDFCIVSLKHNGTFEDSIEDIIEGTWTKDGDVFTLLDADSESSYTLTVNADGSATYVGLNGEEIILASNTMEAKSVLLTFEGVLADAAYGEMSGTIFCYEDGTAMQVVNYAGIEQEIPGEWALAADYSSVTLVFDGVEYVAPINPDDHSFAFDYPCSDGTKDVILPYRSVMEEAAAVYVFVGENVKEIACTLYDDGTCALTFEGLGTVTEGTWSIDTSAGPLPTFALELDDTFENAGVTVETDYAIKFFFAYKNGSGTLSETLALSFEDFQAVQ